MITTKFVGIHNKLGAVVIREILQSAVYRNQCRHAESTATNSHSGKDITSTVRTVTVIPGKGLPPEPPTNCCMSGCSTCVWLKYADEMIEYYKDGGNEALKLIDQLENESMKAYLKMELKMK